MLPLVAITAPQFLLLFIGAVSVYATLRCFYLLYFHPLAKFPGPRIAAVSNVWYAYHWLSGRYPWATEDVLNTFGEVVRIAPNELLFVTSQAFSDIYSPHVNHLESFWKTDLNDRGDKHGGLLFERDPLRHRNVAKKLSPAFSSKSTRAKEQRLHQHIDYFIEKIKLVGADGINVAAWCNWLAMDISADMSYNRKMHQMRDMRSSNFLQVLLGFNRFTTIEQVSKRFPVLEKLKYLFVPLSTLRSLKDINEVSRDELRRRIASRGNVKDLDFFEQLVPEDGVIPTDPAEFRHLGLIATQLLFAGFEPVSVWYYGVLLHLLQNTECLTLLTNEIRDSFGSYEDLTPVALSRLEYLNACLEESMRLLPSNTTGLPRVSPGSVVDGVFVPRGTYVQTSLFAASRSSRNFFDPLSFRPQRWLNVSHPLYDQKFSKDNLKGILPFSQGLRQCPGREIAWVQVRLFLSKVLWVFDIEEVLGRPLDFDKDFITYGFWVKPDLMVRFVPSQN
ncbi:isotrichodermin C-15 hydroxylase [Xylariaceae sp. FL0804]|nr:isotrichodermin C-15 hydroxylase [Xylariaceae sp. FL0804]